MDVLVPPHVDLIVETGEHVTAGETVLGWLPAADAESSTAAGTTATEGAPSSTTP
jgi:hypothetical protein